MALIFGCQLFAQNQLTGTVLDGSGGKEPLIGASVIVKGTSSGGITDINGHFSIKVPNGKTQIVVSSVGYKSQTINISGRNNIRVICISHSNYEGGHLRMAMYRLTENLCDVHTNVSDNAAKALMQAGAVKNKKIRIELC